MIVTPTELARLKRLADSDHPLAWEVVAHQLTVAAPWAVAQVEEWRAQHPPTCECGSR